VIIGFSILNAYLGMRAAKKNDIPFVYYWNDAAHTLIPFKLPRPIGKIVKSKTVKNLSEINKLGTHSPYVSVIIAAYNEEQNIEACLRSVINQDYPQERMEIIVVDDESIDRTAEIAREQNVMVLIQRHSGQGAARNKGVHRASADIIAFIDADDVVCSSWLKELVPLLSNEKVAAVGCTTCLVRECF
jgi:cellulose synthase/poly-beta-1,6-N-acetylglucosamine synthase-like glycosyltransferase